MVSEQITRSCEYFAISLVFGMFTKHSVSSTIARCVAKTAVEGAAVAGGNNTISISLFAQVILILALSHWTICFFALGISLIAGIKPWTGKCKTTGAIPIHAQYFWYPNAVLIIIKLLLRRFVYKNRIPVISEIAPRFYLGGLPGFPGANIDILDHSMAAVDVTCEFPPLQKFERYTCVPAWDCTAPSAEEIKRATDWIWDEYRNSQRSIFIHCCSGVGRSTTIMCAALVKCMVCKTVEEAYELVRKKRTFAKLKNYHLEQLSRWFAIEKKQSC